MLDYWFGMRCNNGQANAMIFNNSSTRTHFTPADPICWQWKTLFTVRSLDCDVCVCVRRRQMRFGRSSFHITRTAAAELAVCRRRFQESAKSGENKKRNSN